MADSAPVSVTTSTYTVLGTANLIPAIEWLAAGAPKPMPGTVVALIATAVMAVVHLGQKAGAAWLAKRGIAVQVPPAAAAALLLVLAATGAACTTGQPQQTAALLESGLTVAEQTALGYFKLPRCPTQAPVCSDPALVLKIAAADNAAFKAIKDVEAAAAAGGSPDTTAATAALTALQDILASPAVAAALKISPATAH